jgi:hypothetical protein
MKKIRRCNMNMPGFTAEASLYKTSEHYKAVGTPDVLAGGVEIVPQQFCTDLRQDFWGEWFNTPTGEPLIIELQVIKFTNFKAGYFHNCLSLRPA